jgi:hypothetical protein
MKNITEEDILSKIGSEVIVTYKNNLALNGISKRKGFLSVENGWIYLYDSGKTGNNYNCAFMLNPTKEHLDLILSIDRV